jgi:hypothetical protein
MSLDFDPIYHTETMVKILCEQGHTQHAMELAEAILQVNPGHTAVAKILEELKEEARRNFERFKKTGRSIESDEADTPFVAVPMTPPPEEPVPLTLVKGGPSRDMRQEKISRLQRLLRRVQKHKKNYEAIQT